jgi:peptidoglycan/LPS O-acetylase OafA/YrhL
VVGAACGDAAVPAVTTAAQGASRALLPSLTVLRVPAMLLVVGFHCLDNLAGDRLWRVPGTHALLGNASVALTVFFALSGYLLTMGWRPGAGRRRFYVRRFARIYPLYLVAWLLAVTVRLVEEGELPSLGVAVATLLLVQSLVPSEAYYFGVDIVFWSLSCEALFYLALPAILPRLHRWSARGLWAGLVGCVVWLATTPLLVATVVGDEHWRTMTQHPLYRGAEFLAGVLACLLVRRTRAPRASTASAVALAVVSFAVSTLVLRELVQAGTSPNGARLVGPVLCLPAVVWLVAVLAASDARGERGWWRGPGWVALGDWTYAVYLVHFPVLLALVPPLEATQTVTAGLAQLALYAGIVVAVSAALHRLVLLPAEARIKERLDPARRRPAAPAGPPAAP